MPPHWVQVVTGKAAEGTYKGFSCMGLPDMGITSNSWPPYGDTLWAGPLSNASDHDNYWILWDLFFFHWWRRGRHRGLLPNFHWWCWWGCCLCGHRLAFKLAQKVGEVTRACLLHCLFEQLPPFCHCAVPLGHHLMPGCYFSNCNTFESNPFCHIKKTFHEPILSGVNRYKPEESQIFERWGLVQTPRLC